MKSKKIKDLLNFFKILIIPYIITIIICYLWFKISIYMDSSLNDLDINKIAFLYPTIFYSFIYIIFLIRVFFWRDYANKKAIKNCYHLNMTIPSKERYKIIVNNSFKILLRQFFIEKRSNNMYKIKTGFKHKKNFYLSNENGELLYVISQLSISASEPYSQYSIIDPYNNDIGEIKIKEPTLSNLQNGQEIWTVILNNGHSFQITFNLYNLTSRKENVVKIINLPLQFNNNFFDEQHLINLDCNLIDTNTNKLIAEIHNSGVFGNSDINIYNDKYNLEIIIIYVCIVLRRYKDGINTTALMPNNISKN